MKQKTTIRRGFDPEADSVSINRISGSAFTPQVNKYMTTAITRSVEQGAHLYFAGIGGRDVGLALLEFPSDRVAYIGTLAVHQSFQERGIGRHLLTHVVRCAKSARFAWLRLDCHGDEWPRFFYRDFGFVETGSRPKAYLDGGASVHMEYDLRAAP
jgi:ribosomal protein S18 acetylase RimI-like enzyme